VYFRTADQVAMVLLGLLMALGILTLTLARVRADADGVEVRNLVITRWLPWSEVLEVSFPAGSRWARLELPDDEYLPVSAIQLVDGQRAVTAISQLRALHAGYLASHPSPDRRRTAAGSSFARRPGSDGCSPAGPWWTMVPTFQEVSVRWSLGKRSTAAEQGVRLGDIVLRNRLVTSSSLLGYGVANSAFYGMSRSRCWCRWTGSAR